MRLQVARSRAPVYVAAALLAAALAVLRTPYSLILPGRAVDLHGVVAVAGHAPPRTHYYLTDVAFLSGVPPIVLLRGLGPGARVVRTSDVVPRGVTSHEYDGIMHEAMDESQNVAAVVAERAAHLRVASPRSHVVVLYFSPLSRARTLLRAGDTIAAVDGARVASTVDVQRELWRLLPGRDVSLLVVRRTSVLRLRVPTIEYHGHAALGAFLTAILERPRLPVAVRYHLPGVSGSSGGLMFAIDIYHSLVRAKESPNARVAGTGTISYDGRIGAIEGVEQKIVAAREVGATIFLVPRDNYEAVKAVRGIRIVPVTTFAQAVAALDV